MSTQATWLGRSWRGAWALLAVVSLLVGALAAGHRYFACGRMAHPAFAACCHRGSGGAQPAIDEDACCHARQLASPDPGFVQVPQGVAPAPLVAFQPAAPPGVEAAIAPRSPDVRWARAGPSRVSPEDRRIRLRVSLS